MCRIAGIIDSNLSPEILNAQIKKMCNVMASGGPDDEGFEHIQNGILGHRRLSLIDLSNAGHQPMQYQHLSIVFNGEIYNFQSLKDQLVKQGFVFNTQSDTEVILVGFLAWGTGIFKLLEGMFAFALYDKKIDCTYLVRDQMGIKPLYYSTTNNRMVFASAIKAFKALDFQYEEEKNWKIYFLAFGHIPHPFTTLQEVFSLETGHYLKWENTNSQFQIVDFTQSLNSKTIADESEAEITVLQNLENAVEKHLIADAPIGVFLSGGIDSSLITLLADKKIGKNLKSLSINFEDPNFSEEIYQEIIAKKIAGQHQSYLVKQKDFDENFDSIVEAMDQPTNDGVNSWFVSKHAKELGLKAVLSGIGADELLGGYPSFKRTGLIKALKNLPKFVLRLTAHLPSDKLKRIYYLSYTNPIGEYLFLRGFFIPHTIAKVLDLSTKEINALFESFPLDEKINTLQETERISWLETNLFMKNQLLKDIDFMSMSHGLEVRVPFLDQNFIQNLDKIENSIRFPERPKGLLINAFKNILPEAIWNRPKMGFSFPLQNWFINGGHLNTANYNAEAARLMQKFKNGKLHWSKAFALYQVFKTK